MKKLSLLYFDKKLNIQENFDFLRRLVVNSTNAFLISITYIAVLIGLDFIARKIATIFCHSSFEILNKIADYIYTINNHIGVKFIDYFKDVIVIVAGVLGVILGLFFTTFLNILTTKYANINSSIIAQVLKQKAINRYFKLLAILVSSSIIFQFLLISGYYPTIVSTTIFTASVIFAILSFTTFGKGTLIYFNASNLVFDLVAENNNILNRAYKNKKHFNNSDNKNYVLSKIRSNIEKIRLIVEESTQPSMSNTDLDSISAELLNFSINYNHYKHTIPSNNEWHLKIQKNKRWEEASRFDHQLNKNLGASLMPQYIDDYNNIEKLIITTQFFVFERSRNNDDVMQLIVEQNKFLQVISFQGETELFELFFKELESFILKRVCDNERVDSEERVQFVSIYVTLINQYLIGFNHNSQRIITIKQLKKLAETIHHFKDTDSAMHVPYSIKIWMDTYQEKLKNEKYIEGKVITPLFYTEYELSDKIQMVIKTHIVKISNLIFIYISSLSKKLEDLDLKIEAYELNREALALYNQIEIFSNNIKNIIDEVNQLNLPKEISFDFKERADLLTKNEAFRKELVSNIWAFGISSYSFKSSELPDLFGSFYQFIADDILNKVLIEEPNELIEYLPKFFSANYLYINTLRLRIGSEGVEQITSKIYPLIVDLLDTLSIVTIICKAQKNKDLEDAFLNCWSNFFVGKSENELAFWRWVLAIYDYFKQSRFCYSSTSSTTEHARKIKLETFLKNSSFIKLKNGDDDVIPIYIQYYDTDIKDIYFKEVVRSLNTNGYSGLGIRTLSEVFIECYLRNNEDLKSLDIKETRYGSNIRRNN